MRARRLGYVALACVVLAAPTASAGAIPYAPQSGISSVQLVKTTRVKLTQDQIAAAYVGKTVQSRQHSTKYLADGTWVNKSGQKGRYKITKSGILVMSGDINLSLEVYKEGDRYYNRNVKSGEGGYYTAN
ncbi:hypothetical protein AB7M35_001565 [Amorphus suaedae]